jgi:hypothetical protein
MGTDSLNLSKRVHRSENAFKDLKNSWNKLVGIAGADVFQLHEWQYSWWNVFGANNDLHIITYWLEDELVAILPFFIENRKLSRLRFIRSLQLIGSHITTAKGGILPVDKAFGGYLDIIVHPDHVSAIQTEISKLFEEMPLWVDQIVLDEVPQHSLLVHLSSYLKDQDTWSFKLINASSCSHCLIDSDWDLYLSTLSRSTRKNIRRGLRSVYDDKIFEIKEAKDTSEFEYIFDELVRLHQDRWHHCNKPGIFADPRLKEFYRSASLQLFITGSAALNWAEKDGKVLAVELTYKYNHTIYAVQNGFDDTSEYRKYSPSNLIIYDIMKRGIENGYLVFDWLRGTESYKSSTANLVLQNQKLTLTSCKRLSRSKIFLSNTLGGMLTKSKHERLVLSVYKENHNIWGGIKNYVKRVFEKAPIISK